MSPPRPLHQLALPEAMSAAHKRSRSVASACAFLLLALVATAPAHAGGFDAFLGHSARHTGLGGTAVGWVDDPSAALHNPAGLLGVESGELLLEAGILLPQLRGAPARGVSALAEPLVAPFGLLAFGTRVHDRIAVGVGAWPIAAAGASWNWRDDGVRTTDQTRAFLIEAAPSIALDLGAGISLGGAWRITTMSLRRTYRAADADHPGLDLDLLGTHATGVRLGAMWRAGDASDPTRRRDHSLGFVWRQGIDIDMEGDRGRALALPVDHVATTFRLPTRLALGGRIDRGRLGATLDLELTLNSEHDRADVRVRFEDGDEATLPAVFQWRDTPGVRGGVEWRTGEDGDIALRTGLAWDGATVSRRYPLAFGPPPASTWLLTLGAGWDLGAWNLAAAWSMRAGGTRITERDVEGAELCAFCGHPGRYDVRAHAIALDVSWRFDVPWHDSATPSPASP